ncbi:6-pyruvoyl-tetrahydropterin synthase-related protein [Liquorilactobacillus oeni]|uniref:Membrane protein 6-pyruvoyl-tetrahydropterin synthase-related domain-containing protein n=1 Tax=Liquorilactobacillus oeni DSM 19972 TaxID=1423777 RepID=A0A0R1MK92_9LACO|nr:6-pyruvoyl-tetrahydropterin synthase-related protein [Liquorilactobacillus oeni]KRL05797.1 hypothetical protein FD46_GL000553 [Liquorilactobacillus oeni DSM 19972]
MTKTNFLKNIYIYIYALFISFVYLVFFYFDLKLKSGPFLGNDNYFHISRLYGLKNAFSHPISFESFNGNGSGVNYFYPWLTYYPAFFLSKIFNSMTYGVISFIFLITVLTFIVAFYCGRNFFKDTKSAFIFGNLYLFSGYRAVNVFQRADIGEIISIAILPAVLVSFYNVLFNKNKPWIPFTIAFSLIIYSHVLSTVFTFFVLILILLLSWPYINRKKATFIALLKSGSSTFLLSSFFWAPMLQQSYYVKTVSPQILNLESSALSPSKFFIDSLNNDVGNTIIGVVLLFILIIGFLNFKSNPRLYNNILLLTLFLLFFSSKLFPWSILQNTPLNIIQYPWRILQVVSALTCFYGAWFLRNISYKTLSSLILLMVLINISNTNSILQRTRVLIGNDNFNSIAKSATFKDYYPVTASNDASFNSLNNKIFFVNGKQKSIKYIVKKNSIDISTPNYKKPYYIDTPFLKYLGLHVQNGGQQIPVSVSKRGTISFEAPLKKSHIIITSWYTKLGIASMILSASTFILLNLILTLNFIKKNIFTSARKINKKP